MSQVKGKIYFGIAVLLCAAVVFFGCEEATVVEPATLDVIAIPANGQVTLVWQTFVGATSYKVYQDTSSNEIFTNKTITGNSVVIAGLTNGKTYSFWVAAVSSGGSTLSAEITATPMVGLSVPAAPTRLSATAGVMQVVLTWLAVPGATSYKVYQGDAALDAVITTPTHTVSGLTAGMTYSFKVSAINDVGEGMQSSAATATPTPSIPAGLTAAAGDTQVVLTWTASSNAGVTGYKIRQTVSGTTTEIDISDRATATHTVRGLTNGTEHSFTIAAVAGSTESTPSTAVTATPLTAPVVTAVVADGQVTLSWAAVTGAASYKIYQGTNSNEILTDSTITGTSAVVTGLTNDQAYSFWVSAVHNSGSSSQSVETAATPAALGTAPTSAPTMLTAVAGVHQVQLSWDGVAGATSYRIYQDNSALSPDISGSASHTVTGLTAGTSYSFTVSALNTIGESTQKSSAATAVPLPPAVTGLAATAGGGQVVLSWTASTVTGVTGYKIRQTVDGTETEIDVSGMTEATHTVTGLTTGKSYSFTIAAVAGTAESTASAAVTATPLLAGPQNVRAAISEDADGTAGSRQQVVLSWDALTGAASYKVYQDSTALAATITGTTHTVSGLTDGQSYSFAVTAVNSASQESTPSATVITCNFNDADGDGLTEICTLDDLQQINVNSNTVAGSYELVRNLDFSSEHSYLPGSDNWTNKTWQPVNTSPCRPKCP